MFSFINKYKKKKIKIKNLSEKKWITSFIYFPNENNKIYCFSSTISDNGDLFLETSYWDDTPIRFFYILKSNGRFALYYDNKFQASKKLDLGQQLSRKYSEIINIKVSDSEQEYLISISSDNNGYFELYDLYTNKFLYKSTYDIYKDYIYSRRNALFKLKKSYDKNYYYLFGFISPNQFLRLSIYKFNSFELSNSIVEKINNKEEIKVYTETKMISCFETYKQFIQCLYIKSDTSKYNVGIFNNNLDLLDSIVIDNDKEVTNNLLFNKCIHLKNEIGIYVYYHFNEDKNPNCQILELKEEDNKYYLNNYLTYFSQSFINLNENSTYFLNYKYFFNDLNKISDSRFVLISSNNDLDKLILILFDLYKNNTILKIRYYQILLYEDYKIKMYDVLRIFIFQGYLGFGFDNNNFLLDSNNFMTAFMIISYCNSTDPNRIDNLDNNFEINLTEYIHLENNLFNFELNKIKIISSPNDKKGGIFLFNNFTLLNANDTINIDSKIKLTYSNKIQTKTYTLEFAGIVIEPQYKIFDSIFISSSTIGNEDQEDYYFRNEYIGKVAQFNFTINNNIDLECIGVGCEFCLYENNSHCIICDIEKGYYFLDGTFTCQNSQEHYYLNETTLTYKPCHPHCLFCIGDPIDDDMNCTKCDNDHNYYAISGTNNCINSSNKNYYFDDDEKVYIKCHPDCKECNKGPIKNSSSCIKCGESNKALEYGNCVEKCSNGFFPQNDTYCIWPFNYFYNDSDNSINFLYQNEKCPKDYQYEIISTKECVNVCNEDEIKNKICRKVEDIIIVVREDEEEEKEEEEKKEVEKKIEEEAVQKQKEEGKEKDKEKEEKGGEEKEKEREKEKEKGKENEVTINEEEKVEEEEENEKEQKVKRERKKREKEKFNEKVKEEYENIKQEESNALEIENEELSEEINKSGNEYLSKLKEIMKINYTYNEKDIIIEEDGIITQITTLDKQNENDKNLSVVDLGKCENELKEYYGINQNLSLIILKMDIKVNNNTSVKYLVYDPVTLLQLDTSQCRNNKAIISAPILLDKNIVELYEELNNQQYDLFNPEDHFYNDVCSPFTSKNGTDVLLSDRTRDYYKNVELCEEGCKYIDYDINSESVICECTIKYDINIEVENIKFIPNKLKDSFFNLNKNSNFKVLKCFKLVFNLKRLLHNYGSSIFLLIILIDTVCIFIFYKYNFSKCKILLFKAATFGKTLICNPIKKAKKLIKKKKIKKSGNISQISSNSNNNMLINNINENENKNGNYNTLSINFNYIPPSNNRIVKKIIKKKRIKKNKQKQKEKTQRLTTKNTLNTKQKKDLANINNNLILNLSSLKMSDYNDYELNNLEYEEAIKIDKRTYIMYYLSLIKSKHLIVSTFLNNNDYNLFIPKFMVFIFSLAISLTSNTTFFDDKTMHKLYVNGKYSIIYQLPIILYSSIIPFFIYLFIKKLALSEKDIVKIKKESGKQNALFLLLDVYKCLKLKFILFFIINFIFLLFFWYFVSSFCAVYNNTQLELIKDSFTCFGFSLIYPIGLYLFPGIIRIPILRISKDSSKLSKCLYSFSKAVVSF